MSAFDPAVLRELPQARRPVVLLTAIGVVQGLATVATAFALTALVVSTVQREPLGAPIGLLVAVFVLRGALAYAGERTAARAGTAVSGGLREQLLQGWLQLDGDRRPGSSRAVTLATQGANSVEPYVARYLPALVAAAVVPTLVLAVLVVVDWPSALIVVLTLPLLPLFAALIGASTRDATRRRWSALTALSGHFLDVVRGLPTLVAYGRAERQVQSISSVSQRHRIATMETLRVAFLSSTALELLATVSVAMVAVAAGLRLAGGSMALSTALTAILLAPEAYWPIRRVGAEFHAAADGAAALTEIRREAAAAALPAAAPARHTVTASVSVREATYAYPGSDRPVLDAISLQAGPGLTVVTGTSGTGKTTLLEVVAGLRVPQSGHVECGPAHLVSQRAFLTAGSLRANLALGNDATSEQIWQALRALGLDGLVAALPHGLETAIGDGGFGLSAGQRARVVLARALLSHSSVVLLDEPTAHLDAAAAELAHGAIRALADRGCVLAVTHRPQLVAMADAHFHLAAGRVDPGASAPAPAPAPALAPGLAPVPWPLPGSVPWA